jgi:hypothetical protein
LHTLPEASDGAAGDDHDDHDHDGEASGSTTYEWAGLFAVPEDIYTWTAQKTGSPPAYADAHMKMAVLAATAGTDAAFDALKAEGNHSLTFACTEVDVGQTMVPVEDACYKLHFNGSAMDSTFTLNLTGVSHVAIFTQHSVAEFERDTHYLTDDHGHDVEALHTLPEASDGAAGGDHDDHDHGGDDHDSHSGGGHDDHDHGGDDHDSHSGHGAHDDHDHGSHDANSKVVRLGGAAPRYESTQPEPRAGYNFGCGPRDRRRLNPVGSQ